MSRIARLRPADLDPEQVELYDAIAAGPRASGTQHFALTADDGSLHGPFNAMLLAPRLGHALQGLGAAVRYGTDLTARVREAAILLVAARWDAAFEVHAHAPAALAAGWPDEAVAELNAGRIPAAASDDERAALAVVVALLDGDLDDAAWTAARVRPGERAVVELSTLVGYYATLALQLRVLRVGVD